MATLVISEKNKAAKAIAEALGTVKIIKKTNKLNIFYVPNKNLYVIPLRGHILEYQNIGEYKSWTKSNPREIITNSNSIKKIPKKYAKPYISALREYTKLAHHCIIGTDADIEGSNIGLFDALPFIKDINPNIKVSQLWLSSLQKNEIINKYNNLVSPKYSWAESGEARAIIDAIIGFSATRAITSILRPLLNKFGIRFTSIGRVQTSLLYLLYLRAQEIENFMPETYFTIEASLIHETGKFKAQHELNPFKKKDEKKAKLIYSKIKDEKIAHIIDQSEKLIKRAPPSPLNTSKALVLLTRILKISAHSAMKIMNSLYLNKIISYPRTDSDIYKSDFNHIDLLNNFVHHSKYGNFANELLRKSRIIPTKGKKDAGDHPPITPLLSLELNDKRFENNLQKKVYDLLARHYLALFGEDATESKQNLKLLIKDEPFKAQLVSLIYEGFLGIAPFLKPRYDTKIQIKGNIIPIDKILLNEKQTKPPPQYSDTTLLKLMEKNHLGTKSTRPIIIRILQTRKLIKRSNYRYLITDLGSFLIENLIKIWLPFLKPTFTKKVEIKLESIKNEEINWERVVSEVKQEFLELFDKLLANKEKILLNIDNFKQKLASRYPKEFPLTSSNCPSCNKSPMKFIYLPKKRFLVCSDDKCKKFLSLPRKGKLELLKSTCSICGFNIFKITLNKGYKNNYIYYLCPKCWNEGLETKSGRGFCSNCDNYKIIKDKCVKK